MKFSINWQRFLPTQTNSFLRWSRNIFFIIGLLALSYVGYVWLDAGFYQARQDKRLEQALNGVQPAWAETLVIPVRDGSPLGRIEISRVGLTAIVQEGVNEGTLRRAVGHFPGTALPGQRGNVALAGHRDTFFRGLRQIRKDDEITLTTLTGSYRYRVESTRVVEPEATEVLDDAENEILTLVTCYPFNFVGSAPQRFIVRAYRIPG